MSEKLKELRIRLELHFDLVCYDDEQQHGAPGEDRSPDPLGIDLLAAIDLLKMLEGGAWTTTKEAVAAWEQRDQNDGKAKPRAV
jgi:hypothetical protein